MSASALANHSQRRRSGGNRSAASDGSDRPITAAAHHGDVSRSVGIILKRVAQKLHALADGFRIHDDSGPHALHELIGRDEIGSALQQCEQQVER